MINKDLSVSIVIHNNSLDSLNKLFKSLSETKLNLKTFVIDNSSVCNNEIKTKCKELGMEYIFNNKNLGYGKAHNIAIEQIKNIFKYHLIVNPDIYFEEGVLEQIYDFMEANPKIGIVMPKIIDSCGRIQYLCKLTPTPFTLFMRRFIFSNRYFNFLEKKLNNNYELRFTGYDKIMEAPCLSGCFMFIRTESFNKAGIFDERFFMYLEDFDLSRKINKHFKTVYYPLVSAYHDHDRGSYKKLYLCWLHIISAVKYFNKWGWFFDKERDRINKYTIEQFTDKI